VENPVQRVRKGSNLVWDGPRVSPHEGNKTVKFEVPDRIIRRYIAEVEGQINQPRLDRSSIDFWLIDEIANRPHTSMFTVELDGREIGAFAEHWPKYKLTGDDEFRPRRIEIPLVIERSGVHELAVRPHMIRNHRYYDGIWHRYASRRLVVAGMQLSADDKALKLPGHPLTRNQTRYYPADFYGWQLPIFYQRYDVKGADLEYLSGVFKEAFHRGANFTSVYLTDCNHKTHYRGVIPWPDEFNLDGKDEYFYNPDTGWNRQALQELIDACQSTGMLTCWYTHLPHIPDHWGSLTWPWIANYTQAILRQFADVRNPPEKRLAGLFYETAGFANDVDMMLLNEEIWQLNPLLFFAESENERERTTAGLAPFRIEYHATTDFAWEDKFSDDVYHDRRWSESQYGVSCYFGQMNCRDRKYSVLYGEMGPDAVVKQVNDTIRQYNLDRKLPGALTGFEWISEAPEVTSRRNREMVYCVSSDPICAAVAYEAETYGAGGRMDQNARRLEERFWFRRRLCIDVPHSATQLQNNYLQLSLWPGNDGGIVLMDSSSAAHFDSDAQTLKLSEPFLPTHILGSTKLETCNVNILRRGPYLAEVEEKLRLLTNEPVQTSTEQLAGILEQRRYAMISDLPMLHAELSRSFDGAEPETQTFIPLAGYDRIRVQDKWFKPDNRPVNWPFEQSAALVMRDSRKLLPDLAIIVQSNEPAGRAPTRLRWRSNDGLGVWWDNPQKSRLGVGGKEMHPIVTGKQAVTIDLVVLGVLYKLPHVPHLAQLWRQATEDVHAAALKDNGVITVDNEWRLPVVKIAKVPADEKLPFWVRESNSWLFRAAQPDGDHDLIKCYLPANGSAAIRRYGYLADHVQPAPGSQYAVILSEVQGGENGCRLRAQVRNVSAAINPGLQFSQPIAGAKINGRQWHCYDQRRLYLPKAVGRYEVQVSYGQSEEPHIIATQAHLRKTRFDDSALSFDADLPPYCRKLAPSIHFYAAVHCSGRQIVNIEGAEMTDQRDHVAILKFKPGRVKVHFSPT